MKYSDIKENLSQLKLFTLNDMRLIDPEFREPTLSEWVSKGWIKKIRRGWYADSSFVPKDKDYFYISNKIYSPSYISLESALSYQGVIPEAVMQVTSITSKKTQVFETDFGEFRYHSVKTKLFFGYIVVECFDRSILIANMEKSLLDYLYLHSEINSIVDFEELRFNKEIINLNIKKKRFNDYLKLFNSEELRKRFNLLDQYLNA